MVLDGRVVALWGAGAGWPGFAAVAAGPEGARFIAPDVAEVARTIARQPFLRPMTLPAGSYAGQASPIDSVGSWSFVLARPGLEEGLAHRLALALHRGEAGFAARLPQARESTARHTATATDPGLLHPGVARALREIGIPADQPRVVNRKQRPGPAGLTDVTLRDPRPLHVPGVALRARAVCWGFELGDPNGRGP